MFVAYNNIREDQNRQMASIHMKPIGDGEFETFMRRIHDSVWNLNMPLSEAKKLSGKYFFWDRLSY